MMHPLHDRAWRGATAAVAVRPAVLLLVEQLLAEVESLGSPNKRRTSARTRR
jgi:hypothetical protein